MSAWEAMFTMLGLAAISVLTRSFFFISRRELPLPAWLQRGLRYAPLAALAAVVGPEIFMQQGHWMATWQDARPWAAAAGTAYFFWRRSILGTIVCGMAVLLPLKLIFGW
jgi:branched-subunit amino acid transport protein